MKHVVPTFYKIIPCTVTQNFTTGRCINNKCVKINEHKKAEIIVYSTTKNNPFTICEKGNYTKESFSCLRNIIRSRLN